VRVFDGVRDAFASNEVGGSFDAGSVSLARDAHADRHRCPPSKLVERWGEPIVELRGRQTTGELAELLDRSS
jgi:hypothetical protein